jgi:hypothetical protein
MRVWLAISLCTLCLAGCSDSSAYTLYRNSATDENMRSHVATFDASDGKAYNQGNCEIARQLFQAQPGVTVRYWCELGKLRK